MVRRFLPILFLTSICWVLLFASAVFPGLHLQQRGIMPRQPGSLPAILWAPFIHASPSHLAANTVPMLILGAILCARGGGEFAIVTVIGTLVGGGMTWVIGREASHIGASGLIFCYFGYLVSLALFNRNVPSLLLSLLCLLGYGGMLRGLFPTTPGISWEGHLSGFVAGIGIGWFIAKVKDTPLDGFAKTAAASPSTLNK